MEAVEYPGPDPRHYPKAKYCVDGSNCVVADARAEASLDPRQWFDHPNQAKAGPPPIPKVEESRYDSDESWEASSALLQPKRRGRPPKVENDRI